jgi:hypothetical protein
LNIVMCHIRFPSAFLPSFLPSIFIYLFLYLLIYILWTQSLMTARKAIYHSKSHPKPARPTCFRTLNSILTEMCMKYVLVPSPFTNYLFIYLVFSFLMLGIEYRVLHCWTSSLPLTYIPALHLHFKDEKNNIKRDYVLLKVTTQAWRRIRNSDLHICWKSVLLTLM